MKKNLEVVALGLGLMGLALGVGCDQQEARADDVPTYVQVEAPKKQEAKPDQPTPASQPTENQPTTQPAATVAAAATVPVPAAKLTNLPATATMPDDLKTSPALTELIRLLQGGVSEDVLTAYITNSSEPFYIGADEILFLHDLGTPAPIITMLIQRDSAPDMVARKQAAASTKPLPPGIALNTPATNIYATAAPPAPNPPEPTPVNPPAAAPAPAAEQVAYTAPPEPANVTYFYSELAPYGVWVDVAGYGRCWRPTVAVWNASWRPYRDCGRWLWTDAGWYWYSDYSWGWAPFHYGRWTCPGGVGWVWVPDTYWGPSWVSWRYSSSYCGWAPLPPSACWVGTGFCHNNIAVGIGFEFGLHSSDYVFVSNGGLCARRPAYLSASHSTTVFKDTTVVNNYVSVNNAKVMNKGVGFDRISHATRGNIRQVALKDTTDVRPTTPRRETLDADGSSLTVSRPPLASPNSSSTRDKSAAPVAVRPRTERNVATVSPKNPSTTTSSSSEPMSSQFAGGSGTASSRGTYLSPRTGPSSAKPSSVTSTPGAKPEGNLASANPAAPRTSPPIRGTYARGGRPDGPVVGGGGESVPNNSSRPTVVRPEPSRSYTQPGPSPSRGNAVRGGGESIQVRPPSSSVGVPSPGPSAPRSAPSQPSARSSVPSSARVEGYRAPVAPPAAHSAPSASSGGGQSSGGGSRSSGGGDSGGKSSSSSAAPSSGGGRGNR
jgi:hypothetical protein